MRRRGNYRVKTPEIKRLDIGNGKDQNLLLLPYNYNYSCIKIQALVYV